MADPIPARAAGTFYERAASARLRGSFAATWVNRMDAANAPPIVVMPDATVDLQWIRESFRIAGPDKEPQTEVLAPDEVVIGFRFHPAAAAAWLGVPLVELVGQRLSLDDVWGPRAQRLASRVRVDDNIDELICSIEEVVTEEITSRETDNAMRAAHRLSDKIGLPKPQ